MANIKPAMPLPWAQEQDLDSTHILHEGEPLASAEQVQDAAYIVHAANAYPQLVAALRQLQSKADALIKANWIEDHGRPDVGDAWEACDKAAALLKELGE